MNVKHLEKPELHTIHDVYIPLPGYEAKLPNNKTTEYMMDLLKVDGLDLQSFRNLTREYDLPGDYRAMLTKVGIFYTYSQECAYGPQHGLVFLLPHFLR